MKTRKRILVVMATLMLGLLLILPSPLIASAAPPTEVTLEVTIFGSTSDGDWYHCDDSYAAARTASSSPVWDLLGLEIGQSYFFTDYCIRRAGLFFDTSVLPDDPILSARLSLFYAAFIPGTDFDVTVVNGAALNDPLVPGDYRNLLDSIESGGSIKTEDFADGIPKRIYITLEPTGLTWIDTRGVTKLGLRSSKDIIGDNPLDENIVGFNSADGAAALDPETYPKLIVSYPKPPPCPDCPEAQVIDGGKTVGGTLQPVNKVGLLLPYLAGAVVLLGLAAYLVRRRVRG